MARIAYGATIKEFKIDWNTNKFMSKICEGAYLNRIGGSPSERSSWNANGAKILSLIEIAKIPDDVYIVFEYKCPLGGSRIDCLLFGVGKDGKENIAHIELKQWSNNTVEQVFDTGVFQVRALVGKSYQFLSHPSKQAFNYQQCITNYVSVIGDTDKKLNGYAYCYNYDYSGKPNVLFDKQYRPIMEKCPLHGGDQVIQFSEILHDLFYNGNGNEIFKEFIFSPIKPTKNLMSAAANIFNDKQEFILLGEQLTSNELIFGMINDKICPIEFS